MLGFDHWLTSLSIESDAFLSKPYLSAITSLVLLSLQREALMCGNFSFEEGIRLLTFAV